MLVSSAGGHFSELQKLNVFNDSIVVTEKTKNIDNPSYLYLKYSSRQNKFKYPFIFLYNCFLSLKYMFLHFKSLSKIKSIFSLQFT